MTTSQLDIVNHNSFNTIEERLVMNCFVFNLRISNFYIVDSSICFCVFDCSHLGCMVVKVLLRHSFLTQVFGNDIYCQNTSANIVCSKAIWFKRWTNFDVYAILIKFATMPSFKFKIPILFHALCVDIYMSLFFGKKPRFYCENQSR